MRSDPPLVGAPDRGKSVATVTELGHLASGVGHHVINAFSAVVSNAEILRLKLSLPDPPDPTVMADAIIRTALDASAVARRLIDVTRPLTDIGTRRTLPRSPDRRTSSQARIAEESGAASVRWSATSSPRPADRRPTPTTSGRCSTCSRPTRSRRPARTASLLNLAHLDRHIGAGSSSRSAIRARGMPPERARAGRRAVLQHRSRATWASA